MVKMDPPAPIKPKHKPITTEAVYASNSFIQDDLEINRE